MNATPRTFAQQVRVARKVNRPVAVYTTSTGDMPTDLRTGQTLVEVKQESDPHCFVCGRHTDHFAEHDDMVEAGTARYDEEGNVFPIPWMWD